MTFDVNKTVAYWEQSAAYDFKTAFSLLKEAKYPYALFFGHLTLEKILKALVVQQTGNHAPFTHSLPLLASKLNINMPFDMAKQLAAFMEFYFEARYPDEVKMFYVKCTRTFADRHLKEIKKVYLWLQKKLP
ncbi:MAG: HEPN domain-containing protein [Planctomycetota bacterium]